MDMRYIIDIKWHLGFIIITSSLNEISYDLKLHIENTLLHDLRSQPYYINFANFSNFMVTSSHSNLLFIQPLSYLTYYYNVHIFIPCMLYV